VGTARAALEAGVIAVDIAAKSFGGRQVLGPIRFELAAGETLAILGPSGVGKTTLLRIVLGMDRAYEGRVTRPRSLAAVFQEPTLLRWRTVLRNVTLFHPGLADDEALRILGRVGIGDRAALFPGQLSLGQQRRLALARAIAGRPELLVLDEPFVSLDPETAEGMLALTADLIAELKPATILVTHDAREAKRLGTRIMRLAGTPATLGPAADT
jgi:sulfonate transport system ATP-binding protein